MKTNPESSSDDKIPSFFLNHNDNRKSLEPKKKNNDTDSNETLSNQHTTKSPKIASKIHWPSLGIGAGIAFACIFCVILITNTINTEPTQVLDEIITSETDTTKKVTLSSFIDNASPFLGDRNAPITLVEFGDYQCTFCGKFFHETEKSIITNYVKTGKVKLLFKDFIVVGGDSIETGASVGSGGVSVGVDTGTSTVCGIVTTTGVAVGNSNTAWVVLFCIDGVVAAGCNAEFFFTAIHPNGCDRLANPLGNIFGILLRGMRQQNGKLLTAK